MQLDEERVLQGARILVVEDDFFISIELDTILADAGAKVVGPCRTVAQAKDLIDRSNGHGPGGGPGGGNRISAAILDFRLGDDTSLSVARKLQRQGIPFVFFTGQANSQRIHAECPHAQVIAKPFEPRTILAAVASLLH